VQVVEGRTETLKDQLSNKAESNNVLASWHVGLEWSCRLEHTST